MRILITATSSYGSNAKDYEPKLEGFKYEEIRDDFGDLLKTYVEINSLEDLEKLNEAVDHELVVDFRKSEKKFNDEPFIEIYDCWRE
jgi:uncharacterized protein YjbK